MKLVQCQFSRGAKAESTARGRWLGVALVWGLVGVGSISAAGFRLADVTDKSLGVWEGDQPVLVYNYGLISRTNVPDDRARSSYVHPLYGLDGEVLTDDFPKDHYHHRGLFWAWPYVKIDGQEYDLWLLQGIRHQFDHWLKRETSAAAAICAVENHWLVGDRNVLTEQVWLRVLPATAEGRAIDVELTLTPTTAPVTLRGAEEKSYGGLTLRFAPHEGDPVITVPSGRTKEDLTMARLPWADLSTQIAGAKNPSGATIFIAPTHPGFPPEWLTRHYGVLCVGWPGVKEQTLAPGKTVRCRYRVWIHRGVPTLSQLEMQYATFTQAISNAPPLSVSDGQNGRH
ncbi:MAG: PmoA family protein [Verrucomicrobiae bacterium]|nr:PmoA family protein [Verrucomicrobiae bacterium]